MRFLNTWRLNWPIVTTFVDTTREAGLVRSGWGQGVCAGDFDNDGQLDIFQTNFEDDVPDLYRNNGNGTFSFETYDAKLGFRLRYLSWGGGFFDFDNDGWRDLFIANGHVYPEPETRGLGGSYRQQNLLYLNLGNGTFDDVSHMSGAGLEQKRSGRGVAFADLDSDGAWKLWSTTRMMRQCYCGMTAVI
jgi:enediyne biosynthesis protein E4